MTMEANKDARLLRIFLGEADTLHHTALYDVIVRKAHKQGLAGATVLRGIMGYGPSSTIRTERILDLAGDLPVVVEIADTEDNINRFLPVLQELFDGAGCGGLVTVEQVSVIRYQHGSKRK